MILILNGNTFEIDRPITSTPLPEIFGPEEKELRDNILKSIEKVQRISEELQYTDFWKKRYLNQ